LIGETGPAQSEVQRFFLQRPILRIAEPWILGLQPGE
jgi:hypothetical protein